MDGSQPSDFFKIPEEDDGVVIRVARTLDDLQKVMMIRALVYMAEQDCPYEEEYDGNDFCGATHLIAELYGEPVGTLRIRWFAGFAKLERVTMLPRERSGRITRKMIKYGYEVIRRKGYQRVLGHIQEHLKAYWKRFGLHHREHRAPFVFSDRAYLEVEGRFDLHPKALTMDTDALILDRPEGEWDKPGPLDRSVNRGSIERSVQAASGRKSGHKTRQGEDKQSDVQHSDLVVR
ncbi:GNAT family N-acetyltransferase [Woodsholea maritima]|uniref:GNAT family N-acetyltransferase n=1 Tax=Woodsholea maritima TaxID=240237 RepID=UPI00035E9901|nr:GNAT family N-acetyltransferase [Woodsholea maritima]